MGRRGFWTAMLACLMLLSAEGAARIVECFFVSGPSGVTMIRGLNTDGKELPLGLAFTAAEILHPFVSYVADKPRRLWWTHGLPTRAHPVRPRISGELRIAIVGGSVARQVADSIEAHFLAAYEDGRIRDRPKVVGLAYSGFKQPQQLNLLTWLIGQGGEFDLVINVDGFNEVALSIAENVSVGVNPYFPRRWDQRVARIIRPDRLREIGRITLLQDLQKRIEPGAAPLLHVSAVTRLGVRFAQRLLRAEIGRARDRLRELPVDDSLEALGPPVDAQGGESFLPEMVEHWARLSRMCEQVVRGHGGEYHHVLQPNQYLAGSKSLADTERDTAFRPEDPLSRVAAVAYPLLRARGAELGTTGDVRFHDATQIFVDVGETAYVDACCHLNEPGLELLSGYIVDEILASTELPGLRPASGG